MFENEAEEYKDNTRIKDKNTYFDFPDECISEVQDFEGNYIDISERIIKTFKDGAEFGYNKANEWHYVKDKLPKELHDVLCFVIHNEHRYVLQGYLRDGRWVLSPLGTYLNNDDVIAWKEIVLPKEIKENEL
jgi:hypothetical protein